MVNASSKKILQDNIDRLKKDKDYYRDQIGKLNSTINESRVKKDEYQLIIDGLNNTIAELEADIGIPA